MKNPLDPRGCRRVASGLALPTTAPRPRSSLAVWTLALSMVFGSAQAIEPPPPPDAPSAARDELGVRLTWAASAGAARYEVYRGATRIGVTQELAFTDDEAPAARAFYFVTACRSWACSSGSPGVTVSAANGLVRSPASPAKERAMAACEIDRTALMLERDELMLERDELRLEVGELLRRVEALSGEPADAGGRLPPLVTADTYACLDTASDVVAVNGSHADKYIVEEAPGRAWDARAFDAYTDDIRHGAVVMEGGPDAPGMCWAGGYVRSTRAVNASWIEHKATEDPEDPSRNTTAIENASVAGIVTGMHVENVGDAFRNSRSEDWLVQHSWAEYVRDDGIENDDLRHGRVYDVLFDGVYSGFSARPSSANKKAAAGDSVVTIERVLLRMEAQPYPYKWVKKGGNINADGKPWRKGDGVPYGHGNIFKIDNDEIPGRNVRWALRDVTFMATHRAGDPDKLDFPPDVLLDECSGVTVIWTGGGDYPGRLPSEKFPDCVTVVTGEEGHALWAERVEDWHRRHPDVGAARKRSGSWRLEWPRSSARAERRNRPRDD